MSVYKGNFKVINDFMQLKCKFPVNLFNVCVCVVYE